jgi:hypothetical protein
MRLYFLLLLVGSAAPSLALAQDAAAEAQPLAAQAPERPLSTSPVESGAQSPTLTPLPAIEPSTPAEPPAVALPPPPPVQAAPDPEIAETPTARPPVLVVKDDKDNGIVETVGTTLGGVAGGAAGAAVAGPVGKFAGGFIGKRLIRGLLGGGDDSPEVTAIPQTPSADEAGRPVSATAAEQMPR